MTRNEPFGKALRRRRLDANMSLTDLATLVFYDRGHLSRVERGLRQASPDLKRDCDAALKADGALASLPCAVPPRRPGSTAVMATSDVGPAASICRPRALVDMGALDRLPACVDDDLVDQMQSIFVALRAAGRRSDAATILPQVVTQYDSLQRLVRAASGPIRTRLTRLAGHCAEFAGWMFQEQGNLSAARRYTRLAAGAWEATDLAAYAHVRLAEISLDEGDGATARSLAERAYCDRHAPLRVRALAAHRIAQGHAINRDARSCDYALDDAERLLARDAVVPEDLTLGTTTVGDIHGATVGWCYYEIGRHAEAARRLAEAIESIPAQSRRARGLFGGRLSRAHASTGDTTRACAAGRAAAAELRYTQSRATRRELQGLQRTLRRQRANADVQDFCLDMIGEL